MTTIRRPPLPRPPARIELVPIGPVEAALLDHLATDLTPRFGVTVVRGEPMPLDEAWWDPDRRQYLADDILDEVARRCDPSSWSLGVLDADLRDRERDFIFGQATVGGCCAVIGLARLREEFYDRPPNHQLFLRRVVIEAVHELGHVAGLGHCSDPNCVMFSSVTIEDTDRKGTEFCERCGV
ncbi:MAG: archaemetzincin family Zn-dependent metalloprotease [Gemmatimonadota bacterium]